MERPAEISTPLRGDRKARTDKQACLCYASSYREDWKPGTREIFIAEVEAPPRVNVPTWARHTHAHIHKYRHTDINTETNKHNTRHMLKLKRQAMNALVRIKLKTMQG